MRVYPIFKHSQLERCSKTSFGWWFVLGLTYLIYGCVWKCCVPKQTQWFCWSLSRHEKWLAIIGKSLTQHFQLPTHIGLSQCTIWVSFFSWNDRCSWCQLRDVVSGATGSKIKRSPQKELNPNCFCVSLAWVECSSLIVLVLHGQILWIDGQIPIHSHFYHFFHSKSVIQNPSLLITLWWTNIAIENGPVEIVDFPIKIAWWIFPVRKMSTFTRG